MQQAYRMVEDWRGSRSARDSKGRLKISTKNIFLTM